MSRASKSPLFCHRNNNNSFSYNRSSHLRSEEQILFDAPAVEWQHKQEEALCFSASLALMSLDLLC